MTNEQKQRLRRDIAEQVMGWQPGQGYDKDWWVDKDGKRQQPLKETFDTTDYSRGEGDLYDEWCPDQDIAAAWQVQERVFKLVAHPSVYTEALERVLEVELWPKHESVTMHALIAATPEQRCLAAYKAVVGKGWE